VGERTRIVALMNGLGIEERIATWFGAERVFGGLAFTCINRVAPGIVHHIGYGAVTLAHMRDDPDALRDALALWKGAKVTVGVSGSLLKARWEKLCWNIPFSGLTVAAGGVPTNHIAENPELRRAAQALMEEVIEAANADLAAHGNAARIDKAAVVQRMFEATDTMGPYQPSLLIDFLERRPMEVDAIFAEPLRRARALAVPAARLALLTALIASLDRQRTRAAAP
jgi:2-dehydropantoate 2-reductase